jgi:hypothetical protein
MKHLPFEFSRIRRYTVTFTLAAILSIVAPLQAALSASEPATEQDPAGSQGAISPGADALVGEPLPEAEPGWMARAQRGIAEREYRASRNSNGLQAPNRAHNLRTYFDGSGIRVHDRTAAGSPELLSLGLAGIGRGESLVPVEPGAVSSEGARVEIRRPGLVEWYANSPEGLEQGFAVVERPEGEGALVLELGVRGAQASLRGERVIFDTGPGRRLSYAKLVAVDAEGRALAARIAVPEASRVRLVVEDGGAVYPLEIDPLLTRTADAQLESDQASAYLGTSVAGAGDVNGDGYADVIVGASSYDAGEFNEGAAFVFLGSASGIADGDPVSAHAQLESDQAEAYLGRSVAGAGDVNGDGYSDVIVGAQSYDAGETNEGAAFVFLGSASGIADGDPGTADAQLESDQASAYLGTSVAGAGDVNGDGYADVIVGAHYYDAGQTDEGAAFVFLGSASGIADGDPVSAHAQLESDQASAYLGTSVGGAGHVNGDGYADVIVGARSYDAGETDEGAAFVFLGSASGIADGDPVSAHAQLESDQAEAYLGTSVGGAGDVDGDGYADVIVGAHYYDAGQTDEGAAFVFLGSASGIADGDPATAAAVLDQNQAGSQMGKSVAGAGDLNGDGYADVIVGAPRYDSGETYEGAAFVFLGSASGVSDLWGAGAARLESDQAGAELGTSVAGAGDVNGDGYADVIAGAHRYDAGETDEGAAFVYLGGASQIGYGDQTTYPAQLVESDQAVADLGYRVSGAGDVNGDGYADVIVGAQNYDAGQTNEGAAFVFLGSASGIAGGDPTTAHAQLASDQAGAKLGHSVAGAGDVNGDGYADVIVGALNYDAGETNEGAAFVFLGSASGIADGNPATAQAQLESNQASAYLGNSVAGAGDVDGDGYADVIVGALSYDAGEFSEGAAFVFLGSAAGIADGSPSTAHAQLESDQAVAELGRSVAGAGDVNGDGYADVIVGAQSYDAGETDEGAAFVFLGSASGIADGSPSTAHAQLESDQAGADLGFSVAGAGDVDGDGYADVIVGAHLYDAGYNNEGAAFVFLGSASGIADGNPGTAHAQLESDQASARLGHSVAGAGDVNGDGYADVIVGAHTYESAPIGPPETDEGAAFVFLGSASGIADGNPFSAHAGWRSNQEYAFLGTSVAGAGDVDGDGYADVIVGAPGYDAGQSEEGAAFVFRGNGLGGGRPVLARQHRGDGSGTPVQPWGRSNDAPPSEGADTFQVGMRATHPEGRGRVKLEVEYCPAGQPFGDVSCGSQVGSSWNDSTATPGGVTLTETVSGLSEWELYRWRARVLYAPYSVKNSGITPPPNPAHGPWRRISAQAEEADILIPEPHPLLLLASQLGLLALLHRRRSRLARRTA